MKGHILGNPYPFILDLTIFGIMSEQIDTVTDTKSYVDEIAQKLPHLEYILLLVCSMEMPYQDSGFLKCLNIDWEPFGYER